MCPMHMESRKDGPDEPMCRTMAERDIQNRFADTVREGGWDGVETMT